jgi:hypothetical protein
VARKAQVAVPPGISPGDSFQVPAPLSPRLAR